MKKKIIAGLIVVMAIISYIWAADITIHVTEFQDYSWVNAKAQFIGTGSGQTTSPQYSQIHEVSPSDTYYWFHGGGIAYGKIWKANYSVEDTQACGSSATFYLALPHLPNPEPEPDPEPEEE